MGVEVCSGDVVQPARQHKGMVGALESIHAFTERLCGGRPYRPASRTMRARDSGNAANTIVSSNVIPEPLSTAEISSAIALASSSVTALVRNAEMCPSPSTQYSAHTASALLFPCLFVGCNSSPLTDPEAPYHQLHHVPCSFLSACFRSSPPFICNCG